MDGEKETAEEKEEEKEEEKDDDDDEELHHSAAATSSLDHQDLPIMHWEDLSQRIAELEKQEQERSKRGTLTSEDFQGQWRHLWEDEDIRKCRVTVVSPRFHNHRNLQLCFINNSDSDDEDEGRDRKVPAKTKVAMGTGHNSCHAAGLKHEVATALRLLRDKLLAEQMEKTHLGSSSCVSRRKHLDRLQLQQNSLQQLDGLRASLQEEVHALSAELVAQLLVRDQLRTKQDAMLLDVQDLT